MANAIAPNAPSRSEFRGIKRADSAFMGYLKLEHIFDCNCSSFSLCVSVNIALNFFLVNNEYTAKIRYLNTF